MHAGPWLDANIYLFVFVDIIRRKQRWPLAFDQQLITIIQMDEPSDDTIFTKPAAFGGLWGSATIL